ncbi:MAG: hypothetical protein EXS17_07620 [Phycisphaerales bacterium]|nr:hypothetical protein [Phycisphaerales bacterium]
MTDPTTPMALFDFTAAPLSADILRRQWKLRRDSYAQAHLYSDVRIRVHRALTWLAVAQGRPATEADTACIELWCAAGSLFARWSAALGAPLPQREATASFARQIIHWDRDGIMPAVLDSIRGHASAMWSDPYLTETLGLAIGAVPSPAAAIAPSDPTQLLIGILQRTGLTVRQLTLGCATYGGGQNRNAVDRGVIALNALVPAFLHVITEHGYVDEWGALCSPPHA